VASAAHWSHLFSRLPVWRTFKSSESSSSRRHRTSIPRRARWARAKATSASGTYAARTARWSSRAWLSPWAGRPTWLSASGYAPLPKPNTPHLPCQVAADSRSILLSGPKTSLLYVLPFSVWSLFGIPAVAIIAVRLYQQRAKGSKLDSAAEGFGPLSLVSPGTVSRNIQSSAGRRHPHRD
jgi:hypothetical protein